MGRPLLLLLGLALGAIAPRASAQTPSVLKIDLVLTPEFCATVIKNGAMVTADRETFPVGEVACAKLPEKLKAAFPQLNVVDAPAAAGSRSAALTLIPKVVELGTNHPTTIGDLKELNIYVEWAAENPDGKLLWLGTVTGTNTQKARIRVTGFWAKNLLPAAIQDLADNLLHQMLSAPSLQAVIHLGPAH